jgi:hypothetical protein
MGEPGGHKKSESSLALRDFTSIKWRYRGY